MNTIVELTSYTSIRDGKFREALFACMGEALYEIEDKQTFVYEVLKRIAPVNDLVTNETVSLENCCKEVLKHFRIDNVRRATLLEIDAPAEPIELPPPPQTYVEKFWKYVLFLSVPPAWTYQETKRIVKEDLRKIRALIKWYELDPFIADVKKTGLSKARNQEEKMKLDFYNRSQQAGEQILDFFLNGLEQKALLLAADSIFGTLFGKNSPLRDFQRRSYDFARAWAYCLFDYREMDLVSHRLIHVKADKDLMKALYTSDKAAFYRVIFAEKQAESIFSDCERNLGLLPLKNDRLIIFNELKGLFRSAQWIGFYALALSQVEGLFGEMNEIVSPGRKLKALPDKVKSIRSWHVLSRYYFDYYEYHVPVLRNKFMHAGYEQDYELKSYDLLIDLSFLLEIFCQLNAPLIKLEKLFIKRDATYFSDHQGFATYFRLLNALTQVQRKMLEERIQEFATFFLRDICSTQQLFINIQKDLPGDVEHFSNDLNRNIKNGLTIDFSKWSEKKITPVLYDSEVVEDLNIFLNIESGRYKKIESYLIFIQCYKKYLSLKDEDMDQMGMKFKHTLEGIVCLCNKVKALTTSDHPDFFQQVFGKDWESASEKFLDGDWIG